MKYFQENRFECFATFGKLDELEKVLMKPVETFREFKESLRKLKKVIVSCDILEKT